MINVKHLVSTDLIIVIAARVIRFRLSSKLSKAVVRKEMRSYLELYGYHRIADDLAELSEPFFIEVKKEAENWERRYGRELK